MFGLKKYDRAGINGCYSEIKYYNNFLSNIDNIVNDEIRKSKNNIKENFAKIKVVKCKEKLKNIPIDEINRNKSGFRISCLKDNGIMTVQDLLNLSTSYIGDIRGISIDSAYAMKNVAETIKAEEMRNIKVTFNPNDLGYNNREVIKELYKIKNIKDIAENLSVYKPYFRKLYDDSYTGIRNANSVFSWIFAGNEYRNNAQEVFEEYKKQKSSKYFNDFIENLNKFKTTKSVDFEIILANYRANMAKYIGLLESIVGSLSKEEKTNKNYLSSDLIKAIESVELDLKYMKDVYLRKYQEFGAKYIINQKHSLLGDEMGLGKTVQALAAIAHLKAKGGKYFLVVVPLGVLVNWEREIRKFTTITSYTLYGDMVRNNYDKWSQCGGIAVTTYEQLSKFYNKINFELDMTVVDEAHFVKNPSAQRTNRVKSVLSKSIRSLFMTGTPIENKIDEMIYLIYLLNDEIAGKVLSNNFIQPEMFRKLVAPTYLRRLREDVLVELPEKIEMDEWVSLNDYEIDQYYNNVINKSIMSMRQVSWDVSPDKSSKMERLKYIVSQAKEEGEKVLVFSFFRHTISMIANEFGDDCVGAITGDVSSIQRQSLIDKLTNAKPGKILACQIIAGGVGLNIQTASYVVICEPQYKPSTEVQAIARSYRMGQDKTVMVYHLLAENSCDESILDILSRKQAIFDQYANESYVGNMMKDLDSSINKEVLASELKRIENGKLTKGNSIKTQVEKEDSSVKLNDSKIEVKEPTVMATVHLVPLEKIEKEKEEKLKKAEEANKRHEMRMKEIKASRTTDKNRSDSIASTNVVKQDSPRINMGSYTVSKASKEIKQPKGGYLPLILFKATNEGENRVVDEKIENIPPQLIGTIVDNLTRIMLGESPSIIFAHAKGVCSTVTSYDVFKNHLNRAKDLSYESICSVCFLSRIDALHKAGSAYIESFKSDLNKYPDDATTRHIVYMVERSVKFFEKVGPVVKSGLDLEGAYNSHIVNGEIDYITGDTIWDMKVLKNAPTICHTLQILMYYIMGQRSIHEEYKKVKYIGIYNPRLNYSYKIKCDEISIKTIKEVSNYVLRYDD